MKRDNKWAPRRVEINRSIFFRVGANLTKGVNDTMVTNGTNLDTTAQMAQTAHIWTQMAQTAQMAHIWAQ